MKNLYIKLKRSVVLTPSTSGIVIVNGYQKFALDDIGEHNIQLFKKMMNTYFLIDDLTNSIPQKYINLLTKLNVFEYAIFFEQDFIYFNNLPEKIIEFSPLMEFMVEKYIYCFHNNGSVTFSTPLNKFSVSSESNILEFTFAALKKKIQYADLYKYLKSYYSEINTEQLTFILNIFLEGKIIKNCSKYDEHANPSLSRWEFHDLLFHMRSRIGYHENPVGRTYPFKDLEPPLSAPKNINEIEYNNIIPLPKPDSIELDISLKEILYTRKSTRKFSKKPLSLSQLSKFLYYSHAVREIIPKNNNQLYESTKRNYPSGGGTYPLEIYLIVNRCEKLTQGVYYYCPYKHCLYSLDFSPTDYSKLMLDAKYANGSHEPPEILLIITSRFGRMNWKYQTMAYSSILKDVGVLFMTMYCVGTALNMGVCALGCGDISTFKNIIHSNIWDESSVGEIIIGNIPEDEEVP